VRIGLTLKKYLMPILIIWLLCSGSAGAKEEPEWRSWPLGERFAFSVGAFKPNIDTTVRAVSTGDINPGAAISFERDLGMSDSTTRPIASANWRFAQRHSLGFMYFNLDRSGDTISQVNIKFGDETITVGLPVESYFDVEVIELQYSYSILFDEKKDLSVGFGISFQDIQTGIRSNDSGNIISEDIDFLAPLPTINARFEYAFTDKWIGLIGLGWLAVEADLGSKEDLEGSIWNSSAGIRYKAFDTVSFTLIYSIFDLDIDYRKRDLAGFIDYKYHGPVLGMEFLF
jgi:hypothetical protein